MQPSDKIGHKRFKMKEPKYQQQVYQMGGGGGGTWGEGETVLDLPISTSACAQFNGSCCKSLFEIILIYNLEIIRTSPIPRHLDSTHLLTPNYFRPYVPLDLTYTPGRVL